MADSQINVRHTQPRDFEGIERLSLAVYPNDAPWTAEHLSKHLELFPEGQFVAVDAETGDVVGMSANVLINWEDYTNIETYLDFTDGGYLTNHDPKGKTLYGADVMVDPNRRGQGIGAALYEARKDLVRRLALRRIRGHARLPGYHEHADERSAEEYVRKVVNGDVYDPTLSFQIRQGFRVLGVAGDYFARDPRSRGNAALIEWINDEPAGDERSSDGSGEDQPSRPSAGKPDSR